MAREANRGADANANANANANGHPSSAPAVTEGGGSWSKVKKNLRGRVPFVRSSSGTRPSCWGSVSIHRIGRSRSRGRMGGDDHDTPPAVRAVASRVCLGDRGRCGCSGKAGAAAGLRSLLQRNDFYCDDCNTHR